MKYYSTGEFAKRANVTLRTIRYYDKVGLLKPSFVMENGYRKYSDQDYIKLQKIISLKQLGFSLEEIYPLILDNDKQSMIDSMQLQIELVNKKLVYLQRMKDSLKSTKQLIENDSLEWNKVVELINLSNKDEYMIEDYKNAKNLQARIQLHNECSTAKKNWFTWLFSQIQFNKVNRLLEIGCGNGELWKNSNQSIRNRDIYLSDISEGMIEDAKQELGNDFSYFCFNCTNIPFKDESFDAVVMNHTLFQVHDIPLALAEIKRVLKPGGIFYCSTYGRKHMQEINQFVHEFDEEIELSQQSLYEQFGLENGRDILAPYFMDIQLLLHKDSLCIQDSDLLFNYIVSSYGNQNEIIGKRLIELKDFISQRIIQNQQIMVTKEAGLFIAKKNN